MVNCEEIERGLAGYVDGAAEGGERAQVEAHLRGCPRCRTRAARERTVRELLATRRNDLRGHAPEGLRGRCEGLGLRRAEVRPPVEARAPHLFVRRPWLPLSAAAAIIAAVGLSLFGMGSVESYAAQLAMDHLKCSLFPPPEGPRDLQALATRWQAHNGWPLRLAPGAHEQDLELLGLRRCTSTWGRMAHVLYRWRGEPLSVFVLNTTVQDAVDAIHAGHGQDSVQSFADQQEIIWAERGRTYAVVARAPTPDLQRVAYYVRRSIE